MEYSDKICDALFLTFHKRNIKPIFEYAILCWELIILLDISSKDLVI